MKFKSIYAKTFVVLGLLASVAIGAESQAVVEEPLRVGRVSVPPVIDGNLDDACWREASMASGFIRVDGYWASEQTTTYAAYDDNYLYIAYRCRESSPGKLKEPAKKETTLTFHGNIVELFLDINLDRATYYHFAANHIGTRYEASCSYDKNGKELIRKAEWNPQWEVKTRVGDAGWTAELRIPFASLGITKPKPNSTWGVNFNRSRWAEGKVEHSTEHSSWAMMTGHFNRPRAFGEMIFGEPAPVSCSVISAEGPPTNKVRLLLRNGKDTPVTARTELKVSTALGGASSFGTKTHLKPNEEKEISVAYDFTGSNAEDVPISGGDTAELVLTVADDSTGKRYDFRKGAVEISPMQMSLERYYYTPDVTQIDVVLDSKSKKANHFKVEISEQLGGKVVASKQISLGADGDKSTASFDITGFSDGRYVASAHSIDSDGERIGSVHRVFFKRDIAPAPDPPTPAKMTIRKDGILLLNGNPFCPFYATETDIFSPLAADSFNVKYGENGLISKPLKRRKVGLPWVTREEGKTFILLSEEKEMLRKIRGIVEPGKSDPSLLCWFLKYEAKIPMYRGKDPRVRLDNVKELNKIHRFVKKLDPDHLTFLQVEHGHGDREKGDWPSDMTPYRNCADVLEIAARASYHKRIIPDFVKSIEEVKGIIDPSKPFLMMIGSSIPAAEHRTAEEIRCATYLALMHGATGIIYHMGHLGIAPSYTRHWSVYPGLSREVAGLFPIISEPQQGSVPEITVIPESIDYCVRRYKGKVYLIAVNTSERLVHATFSIADRSLISKRVKVLLENREIAPEGNKFTDAFTAFEPHVYELLPVK